MVGRGPGPAPPDRGPGRGHGGRPAQGGRPARPGRRGRRGLGAAQRPAGDAGPGPARRRRRDLREPTERDERRRRAVPQGGQRRLPARLVLGHRLQPGRGRAAAAGRGEGGAARGRRGARRGHRRTRRRSTSCGCAGYIDCLIPRGGPALIASLVEHATVPYVLDGDGNCHIYVDGAADLAMAHELVVNAKTHRFGVCNAVETILVHAGVAAELPAPAGRVARDGGRRDPGRRARARRRARRRAGDSRATSPPSSSARWWPSAMVDDVGDAIEHIARYGSGHSEAIVTSRRGDGGPLRGRGRRRRRCW